MARLIRTKKLSAREALAQHLKQIERVNPKVNAIVTLVLRCHAQSLRLDQDVRRILRGRRCRVGLRTRARCQWL
jgi:amidase